MRINEEVFNDQMRGLLVARGGYTSEKKKEEIKRYWYIEFRDCDERAFIEVMGKLKFAGKSGDGFPSFRDFKEGYNAIIKPEDRLKGRPSCGACNDGKVFYRGVHRDEVRDLVKWCQLCRKDVKGDLGCIDPRQLHKDRIGQLRTLGALAEDRKKLEIQRPSWLFHKHPKLKDKKVYFQGLHPQNDPDIEFKFELPPPTPVNGKQLARAIYGAPNPKKEAKREISLKKDAKEEEFPGVPY